MEEKPFQVVFSGKVDPNLGKQEILGNLVTLFRTDSARIRSIFRGPGAVVASCATREQAEKYVAVIRRAGAICSVRQREDRQPEAPPSDPPGNTPAAPAPLEPVPGNTDLTLAPVGCTRIGSSPEGLTTNRMDRGNIPYAQLSLVAVFKPAENRDELRLLLFARGNRRPLLTEASSVMFGEFPGIAGNNLHASLRNFLAFLRRKNPALLLDGSTNAFLSGEAPALFTKDPIFLVSDLDRALARVISRDPPPAVPPAPPTQAYQTRPASQPAPSTTATAVRAEPVRLAARVAAWGERKPKIYAVMLLAGFLWPLFKHSLLFSSQVLWPWNLMGFGLGAEKAAAMATISGGKHLLAWGILPFAAALSVLLLQKYTSGLRRFAGLLVLGGAGLIALLVLLVEEAEIFGLVLVPPSPAGGAMAFLVVIAGAAAAAANHLRKEQPDAAVLRVLTGAGGGILILAAGLAFLASSWSGWTIQVFYLLLAAYGGLSLRNALSRRPEESSLNLASAVCRGLLVWFPVACLFTQSAQDDPFTEYVVGGGGGFLNLFVSVVKLCLIYYPLALLMALGIAGTVAVLVSGRGSHGET